MATLEETLGGHVRIGDLWEPLGDKRVRCYACGHRCPIPEGQPGVCKVRFNRDGALYVPWGYVAGVQCDPIEKKPFFHVRPGALALSFGMLGCDLHCAYCQNWVTSQALRDPDAMAPIRLTTPEYSSASRWTPAPRPSSAPTTSRSSPPSGPRRSSRRRNEAGLLTGFVSNGNATPEVLDYLRPHLDLYKVDLKSFDDRRYRNLGGRLQPILETIRQIHGGILGGGGDAARPRLQRLRGGTRQIAALPGRGIARYSLARDRVPPGLQDARPGEHSNRDPGSGSRHRAAGGAAIRVRGNLPGRTGNLENTLCPGCGETLVTRHGFRVRGMQGDERRALPGLFRADTRPLV